MNGTNGVRSREKWRHVLARYTFSSVSEDIKKESVLSSSMSLSLSESVPIVVETDRKNQLIGNSITRVNHILYVSVHAFETECRVGP